MNDDRTPQDQQRPERRRVLPADHRRRTPGPAQQVAAQRHVERCVGEDARVVDAISRAARAPSLEELRELAPVRRGRRAGPPSMVRPDSRSSSSTSCVNGNSSSSRVSTWNTATSCPMRTARRSSRSTASSSSYRSEMTSSSPRRLSRSTARLSAAAVAVPPAALHPRQRRQHAAQVRLPERLGTYLRTARRRRPGRPRRPDPRSDTPAPPRGAARTRASSTPPRPANAIDRARVDDQLRRQVRRFAVLLRVERDRSARTASSRRT